jgi:hypothetical protein
MIRLQVLRCALCAGALALAPTAARSQGTLEAVYSISIAHIPIGRITASADIGAGEYTISASGRAAGLMKVLASGDGTLTSHGTIEQGRPAPSSFIATTTSDDDKLDVRMTIENGNVQELAASPPPPKADRVALTEADRKGITDPLSALLIPTAAGGDGLGAPACERTLPIFDGRRRFDLKLAFKRMDTMKAEKGYAGPVVVCSLALQPIAGHRASSPLVKYLTGGREIEIAFAPVAGTAMLAPLRVSVANMLGNLVVQASRFEALARSSLRAAATTGPGD